MIHYGWLTFRDLRMDKHTEYNGRPLCIKYYIVKKTFLPRKKLLEKHCNEQYDNFKGYDIMAFHFYNEAGKMPWFWKNEEPFLDLEMLSDCMLGVFWVTDDEIEFGR